MLPAYCANMAPMLVGKLNILDCPADFNIELNGNRLLGKNKTIRGFVFGILTAIAVVYCQGALFSISFFKMASVLDYSKLNIMLFGFLMGFGALFGDSLKSFVKRRLNIKPGAPWFPFDQIDYVIGVIIFTWIKVRYYLLDILFLLLTAPLLNISFSYIGYCLGIKKEQL